MDRSAEISRQIPSASSANPPMSRVPTTSWGRICAAAGQVISSHCPSLPHLLSQRAKLRTASLSKARSPRFSRPVTRRYTFSGDCGPDALKITWQRAAPSCRNTPPRTHFALEGLGHRMAQQGRTWGIPAGVAHSNFNEDQQQEWECGVGPVPNEEPKEGGP